MIEKPEDVIAATLARDYRVDTRVTEVDRQQARRIISALGAAGYQILPAEVIPEGPKS
jgi:hypothetical protein